MKANVLAVALMMALTTTTAFAQDQQSSRQDQQSSGSQEQSVRIERKDIKSGALAPKAQLKMHKRARQINKADVVQLKRQNGQSHKAQQIAKTRRAQGKAQLKAQSKMQKCPAHHHHHGHHPKEIVIIRF